MRTRSSVVFAGLTAVTMLGLLTACVADSSAMPSASPGVSASASPNPQTTTPIKHLVVIYDENVSFDHYFGTYPKAANTDGVKFTAIPGTPTPVNLLQNDLLTKNPNEFNPLRLTPSEAVTCDQDHSYGPEQEAADNGKNDKAVQFTSGDSCGIGGAFSTTGLTMGYYDGNTVTALWSYAQHYAMNDNSYGSTFGPSTPGALNLAAGQTHGMTAVDPHSGAVLPKSLVVSSTNADNVGTDTGDVDPAFDDCSGNDHTSPVPLATMTGKNVGDLLNAQHVSWGWFQGGFAPTTPYNATSGSIAKCDARHDNVDRVSSKDYVPHHNPFAYYTSTSNPHHLPPSSTSAIGETDQANHNYDLTEFDAALKAGVLPSVSFLKPAAYQNGHAANSDPLDEQHFLVSEINAIESSKYWATTAIVIAYDDSDGWYDQKSSPVLNGSNDQHVVNSLVGDQPMCVSAAADPKVGVSGGYADRCGPGPRLPLLVISPFAKANYIDDTPTEQASIPAFIENNWTTGRLGDASFDARAGTLQNMFDFTKSRGEKVILRANGTAASAVMQPVG
ncbi:MAG: phospholipase [Actinomycetota bacterium]|nr:phospholipase [Actinomycetota bacterium]